MLALRKAELEDVELSVRIAAAVHPDEPEDPAVRRHRWARPDGDFHADRHIVEEAGEPVGFVFCGWPARWPDRGPRHGRFEIQLLPEARSEDAYAWVLAEVERRLGAAGATVFAQRMREDEGFTIAEAERHGYRYDRLSKAWELDLVARRDVLLAARAEGRARMAELGVNVRTLAETPGDDVLRRVYELDIGTTADVPTTIPHRRPSFDFWRSAMASPDIHDDRVWVGWVGLEPVALSFLAYPAAGNVWTGYTCCAREHRGRGIARAVKLETLGQAIELGATRVRTDNDEANAPMLHINEQLGYHRIPGFLSYLKQDPGAGVHLPS